MSSRVYSRVCSNEYGAGSKLHGWHRQPASGVRFATSFTSQAVQRDQTLQRHLNCRRRQVQQVLSNRVSVSGYGNINERRLGH